MSKWTNFRDKLIAKICRALGFNPAGAGEGEGREKGNRPPEEPEAAPAGFPPAWDACSLASSWGGTNASVRVMNCLSPRMSDQDFAERVAWTKQQGANAIHLFLVNKGDGEKAGYSPWGAGHAPCDAPCDAATVALMRCRIDRCRAAGLGVVLWLMADDSSDWAKAFAASADACLRRIADAGLLAQASTVVLGLEMDEYWDAAQAKRVAAATRKVWEGKTGTHHTSGKATFAALGDVLFYQVSPGRTAAQIKADTAAALKHGKPVNFFELDRGPNKALALAALDAGAFGVGNCAPGVRAPSSPSSPSSPAAAPMDWRYGGFDGSKAKEDPRCRLALVSIGKVRIAYKWETGIPSDWTRGKTEKGMMVIAAAFYWDGARWVGGKMDWTDEARSFRDTDKIHGGYNGWQSAGWDGAARRAFCVASADGKFRSNLIEG